MTAWLTDTLLYTGLLITLVLILWALVAGGLVLVPSMVYLLRVFKREHPAR